MVFQFSGSSLVKYHCPCTWLIKGLKGVCGSPQLSRPKVWAKPMNASMLRVWAPKTLTWYSSEEQSAHHCLYHTGDFSIGVGVLTKMSITGSFRASSSRQRGGTVFQYRGTISKTSPDKRISSKCRSVATFSLLQLTFLLSRYWAGQKSYLHC